MSIKVLLVDDHKIMRDGLASLLSPAEEIDVVAEAATGGEAIEKAREYSPDVVVMDLTLPDIGGTEATRRIVAEHAGIRVLVLSMLLDKNCLLESLEAGAKGYLIKDCAAEELVTAIRSVFAGKPYYCADAMDILIKGLAPHPPDERIAPTLTKRELEVLKLTAEGSNTKEIAFDLGISTKMVEIHRMNIRKKLGLKSIAQLTTYAARIGLISID
ncbi:oxygen regulatory protein NreC [Geobacter sp. OR-1]|uniref:response regulator transcription factor n=1 Tax=Geobacter sp. OR-1 TaxID=1266765 RepID=UPI000542AA0E|nr:response regulator transcription factor [Geobacter sp. OR-1]GAM10778.1 oxygen regulatory protein NreC [Geobacter sp. OR-1]